MTLASPFLLAALLALPLLWWLLRLTPPAPRTQDFPAVRLLLGIETREETPDRTPWPILLLRLLAAASLILGLAGPTLSRAPVAPPGGHAGLILVIDNGWASAHDWSRRIGAADRILADAASAGRAAALLPTARSEDNAAPALGALMPAALLRERLAALRPMPWPADRGDAASALRAASKRPGLRDADIDYVADGVATDADGPFLDALRLFGVLRSFRDQVPAHLLLPPRFVGGGALADTLVEPAGVEPAGVEPAGGGGRRHAATDHLLALDGHGDALDRATFAAAGAMAGTDGRSLGRTATIRLPVELRNQLDRLTVEGSHAAAGTILLDESDRRRPIGLLETGTGADTPLIGPLYYLARAFPPGTPIRTGTADALLGRPLSVLIAPDGALADPAARRTVLDWVRHGGTLIRFSGPHLAAETDGSADAEGAADPGWAGGFGRVPDAPPDASTQADADEDAGDPLLPVPLLPGARALGGAMSWGKPQHLAPFDRQSPFHGLPVPAEVTVSRQVLARPSVSLARHVWASLDDGTPVVTASPLGEGRIVLFHVTANADWSNLPLSVLFVDMLDRVARLAAGVPSAGDQTMLAPLATLDAFGQLGPPTEAATGIAADLFGSVVPSPLHPPGIYGAGLERRALNLSDALPLPTRETNAGVPGPLAAGGTDLALGPWLLGLSLALLAVDLAVALALRGLIGIGRRGGFRAAGLVVALAGGAVLAPRPGGARAVESGPVPKAALETELAYVVTGDGDTDRISREGLSALSDVVNSRTAATLGPPAGVVPGRDDLSFYPLLYWPVLPDAAADPKAAAALDAYMRTGGIVLIDTEGGDADGEGSGAGFAPGSGAALRRVTAGLDVPPLSRLTSEDVLAHTFYLLRDFPGRFVGAPVWLQRRSDPANDGVSPIIIGSNDWAAAWAVAPDGSHEVASVPGGDEQRVLSLRFGVNLVMYALTGNYKADQVHVPAILQRLGEAPSDTGVEEGE